MGPLDYEIAKNVRLKERVANFLIGFQNGADRESLADAAMCWAEYSCSLSAIERASVEADGYNAGLAQGRRYLRGFGFLSRVRSA